jgi:xanthine dehydrogenase accessory factor
MEFYDVVSELNTNAENRMFTVCSGAHAGERMIRSAGETVWLSDEQGFFAAHGAEAAEIPSGSLYEVGGESVFAELLGNETRIVICGAGHVSMPVIRIAKMMRCHVTAIDDREQFVQNAIDHGADEGVCMGFEEALADIPGSKDTYFVIVTRGHKYDAECLLSIVKKPHAYIGMIGSRRKVSLVREALADAGVPQDVIDSVHMPIGLDIGAETPEEIAVAIIAEIIEVKNRGSRSCGFAPDIMKALQKEDREAAVLATIISKQGSSPRAAGTRMLAGRDGIIAGTIGGGLAEARAAARAAEMLQTYSGQNKNNGTKPVVMKIDMAGNDIDNSDMICGGMIEVMLETV